MAGIVLTIVSTLPAAASEVAYPKTDAKVQLRAPDDWKISETALGLEVEAPGKDSLVVAAVLPRDQVRVNAWVKDAIERMTKEGVTFRGKDTDTPQQQVGEPSLDPPVDHPSTAASTETFTFSGQPAIGQPGLPSEEDLLPDVVGPLGVPMATMGLGKGGPMHPFRHFYYKGTTMHGKPIDVELAIYALGKDQLFLIEQMSGPVDPRGVMIVRSLRGAS